MGQSILKSIEEIDATFTSSEVLREDFNVFLQSNENTYK